MPFLMPAILTIARRWLALPLITLALTLGVSQPAAIADSPWVEVARSSEGVQYVDPSSIEATPNGVRLKSYWQPAPSKGLYKPVYYVTEYDCQGRYRDVEVANRAEELDWSNIGSDALNRGAMNYGCAHQGTLQGEKP
ncbi:MAG: hypothetical protein AAF289_21865 [Cyanobacteria bacterium P01_A01_bin.135]